MATVKSKTTNIKTSAAISNSTTSVAAVTIYTCPANSYAIINVCFVCPNTDGTSCRLVVRTGATDVIFVYGFKVSAGVFGTNMGARNALGTRSVDKIVVGPGQIIQGSAATGGTVFISGIEYQNTGP